MFPAQNWWGCLDRVDHTSINSKKKFLVGGYEFYNHTLIIFEKKFLVVKFFPIKNPCGQTGKRNNMKSIWKLSQKKKNQKENYIFMAFITEVIHVLSVLCCAHIENYV